MNTFLVRVLTSFALVSMGAVVLLESFLALMFERSLVRLATDSMVIVPVVLIVLIAILVWLGRFLASIEGSLADSKGASLESRLEARRRLAKIPARIFSANLVLFSVLALVSILSRALFVTHSLPGILDLTLNIALHLAFGFMASLQQISWFDSQSLRVRENLALRSVDGGAPDMSLRRRLFLVTLASVLLSGLLAGMAALGFYREVVAYYSSLEADVVSAASAVSAQAINENELRVVLELGLLFLAVLTWTVALTITALNTVSRQMHALELRVREMAEGSADLGRRAEVVFFDEVGLLTGRINSLMERLQSMVAAIQTTSAQVLDSTQRVQKSTLETESRLDRVEEARVSAFQALGGQGEALGATLEVAQKLEASSTQVREAAGAQTEAVTRGAATMEQLVASVSQVSSLTEKASGLATSLRTTSEQGGQSVEAVRRAMEAIQTAAQAVAGTVASIKKTASQTNLLAMNAAIEAAHAGASGLGFAVVATEVRVLAENSSQGAKTIFSLMKDMDSKISEGDRLAREAGEAFTRIYGLVVETTEVMGTVARAMAEQKVGTQTILSTTRTLRDASVNIGTITDAQSVYAAEINKSVMVLLEAGAVLAMAQDVQSRAVGELIGLVTTVAKEAGQNLQIADDLKRTVAGFTVH